MKTCLKNTETVAGYLLMELMKMGYRLECNRSAKSSDSWYIKIYVGTWKYPNAVYLRISDHTVLPKYRETVRYDFDICGSRLRNNAVTYIDFLSQFTLQHNKPLSQEVIDLLPGTQGYETYVDSLRLRKAA